MEEVKQMFHVYSDFMDQNIKGVEIGCYSLAIIGLSYSIRKMRPFSRFKRPSDIPNRFIQERRELIGTVQRIEPGGGLLMIEHKPLIPVPGVRHGTLPVKISNINVSGLGVNWLQAIVAGNEVNFVPVMKSKDYVHCEVLMPQKTIDNKLRSVNVGELLVSVGFGAVTELEKPLSLDPKYMSYYNRLKLAELNAIKKKMGIKYYILQTKNILVTVALAIQKLVIKTAKTPKSAVA